MLDTMVFSYHLSDHPRYAPLTTVVLETIESGKITGLTTHHHFGRVADGPGAAQ